VGAIRTQLAASYRNGFMSSAPEQLGLESGSGSSSAVDTISVIREKMMQQVGC
jgi:hypothetical protein